MNFTSPLAFLLLPGLILIYLALLMAQRRKTAQVPSLLIWKRLLKRLTPPPPPPRRHWDLLTMVRMAAFLLLVMAATGPEPLRTVQESQPVNLFVDCGVATQIIETDGRSRKAHLLEALNDLLKGPLQNRMVRVTCLPDDQKSKTHPLLKGAEILDYIRKAPSLYQEHRLTASDVGKDGGWLLNAGSVSLTDDARAHLEVIAIGKKNQNLGWTAFEISAKGRVFAVIHNNSSESKQVMVRVYSDGKTIDARKQTVRSGSHPITMNLPSLPKKELRLTLETSDALSADNTLVALRKAATPGTALLIGSPMPLIKRALEANDFECFRLGDSSRLNTSDASLVVALGVIPKPAPPCLTLLIMPEISSSKKTAATWWDQQGTFKHLPLNDLILHHIRSSKPPETARTRVRSGENALAWSGTFANQSPYIYIGWDLNHPTMTRTTLLPVLFANIRQQVAAKSRFHYFRCGDHLLKTEDGRIQRIVLNQTGIIPSGTEHVAVNLLNPEVTAIPVPRSSTIKQMAPSKKHITRTIPLRRWLALAGLLLCLVAWKLAKGYDAGQKREKSCPV